MSADALNANYLRIAGEDLDAARALALTKNRNAIDHCEQAAEKVIRAVMTSESLLAGTNHLLARMVDQIPDANPLKPALRGIEHLAAFATSYRYPTSTGRILPTPSEAEVTEAIRRVDAVLLGAAARFAVDLTNPGTPARRIGPIR